MSDSVVRVPSAKPPQLVFNSAAEALSKTGTVELHGLGKSTTSAVRVAEMLTSSGLALSTGFRTELVTLEGSDRPAPKVVITLSKSPNFAQLYEAHIKAKTDLEQTKK